MQSIDTGFIAKACLKCVFKFEAKLKLMIKYIINCDHNSI